MTFANPNSQDVHLGLNISCANEPRYSCVYTTRREFMNLGEVPKRF